MTTISVTILALALLLAGCTASPPRNVTDVCEIFEDRRAWHKAAKRTAESWGVPVGVSMAFVYQESSFQARARPERQKLLWVIPWSRPSTAYGYGQVLESTWQDYVNSSDNRRANRNDFADVMDFIGWYNSMSMRQSNITPSDAASLYLAYHEGNTGYRRGSYRGKQTLLAAASRVQQNASRFESQYARCKDDLDRGWFFGLFG